VCEHRLLQSLQLRAGLEPELAHQRPAGVGICLQRLGLAAGAVEGEHQLGT
jgi:hypothetical protein